MSRPLLQFSHANGFPAPCYRAFLAHLAGRFDIRHVDRFGHDPRHPVAEGWHALTDELIGAVESHGQPAVLLGHSLGGYLSFRVALQRPDLVRGVVLLDAPLLSRFKGGALALTKRLGLVDRFTPAPGTQRRRREWVSPEAAAEHFRAKPVFRRFAPEALDDYVRHGTVTEGGSTRLAFDPDVEYRIYRTLPHGLAREGHALSMPAGLVVGEESEISRRVGLALSRRWMRVAHAPGGHLFPFQFPEQAAHAVLRMLAQLGLAS